MEDTAIYKLTLYPKDFVIGLEYYTGGNDLRVRSDDKPREGLFAACARVLSLALAFCDLPTGLHVGFKSIEFPTGDEPGSVVKAEGLEKKIKLQLPKISSKVVERRVAGGSEWDREVDPEHPQNKFNLAVKDLREEILFYIRGQRQQLAFSFEGEEEDERAVADKITRFPGAKAAP